MTFDPRIRTEPVGVDADFEFLASEHAMYKRAGVTIDQGSVNVVEGRRQLVKGQTMAEITASGKWGPYDTGASDGRETARGFLLEAVDVTDGDVIAGVIIHGSVLEARVSGLDSSAKDVLAGAFLFQ